MILLFKIHFNANIFLELQKQWSSLGWKLASETRMNNREQLEDLLKRDKIIVDMYIPGGIETVTFQLV